MGTESPLPRFLILRKLSWMILLASGVMTGTMRLEYATYFLSISMEYTGLISLVLLSMSSTSIPSISAPSGSILACPRS